MADFSQSAWANHVARLPADERRQHMRDLSQGVHRVFGADDKPLDLSAGPATCETAPRVDITKDQFGRTKRVARTEPTKPVTSPVGGAPRLSDDDKQGFEIFMKSFDQLAPAERAAATQKLVETYIPRLIHD